MSGSHAKLPHPQIALVSMPWQSAWMPSIQLAILRQCLAGVARADTYELYVDYAATISERLYRRLSEAGGIIEEWLFAKHFFEGEGVKMPEGFLDEFPTFDLESRDRERQIVSTLAGVTGDFLDRLVDEHDWGRYDVVAFSLTIYQTASSMALARLIRRRHPGVRIVFGGSSCVGPAGSAILEICPYVDVVVQTEAEPVFARLVERLSSGMPLDDLPGLVFRDVNGRIVKTRAGHLHDLRPQNLITLGARKDSGSTSSAAGGAPPPPRTMGGLDYDAYFRRVERLQLSGRENIWLPFESSRGCWWGEKSQCTFCGLHEIMRYRARDPHEVLKELDDLHARYGIPRFFAMDLIMPQEYYHTLLPELQRSGRHYELFYELKGNVTREMVALLAKAGVRWVQPGLESLSTPVLKLMKKGISATQNVQFLKWATDYGIHAAWNIIAGIPGEDPEENERAAARIPSLYHLQAPYFIYFELDRYSPIFEHPEQHGLKNLRPLYIYRYVFPVEDRILRSLVYRFEYDADDFGGTPPWIGGAGHGEYAASLGRAIAGWKQARAREASLTLRTLEDGSGEIHDTRFSEQPKIYSISADAVALYEHLDARLSWDLLADAFAAAAPEAFERLGGRVGVEAQVHLWVEDRLVFEEDGHVVALALTDRRQGASTRTKEGREGEPGRESAAFAAGRLGRSKPQAMGSVEEMQARLARAGLLGDSLVASVERMRSVREAFLVRLDDDRCLFIKECTEGSGDAPVYEALKAGCLPSGLERFLPTRHLHDREASLSFDEGLADHRAWYDLLAADAGFDPDVAVAVGTSMADLHSLPPPADLTALCAHMGDGIDAIPIRSYDRITVAQLAGAPGMHYRQFLEVAQRIGPRLAELRRTWVPSRFIHGDLKADNVLLSRRGGAISVRFIDWELARMGDPLFDVGTAAGSLMAAWVSLLQPAGSDMEDWLGRAPISSVVLGRCLLGLTDAYAARAGIGDKARLRRQVASYAGVFLLERGLVANLTAGRLTLGAKLCMELGARILEMPDEVFRSFALMEEHVA